MIQGEAVEAVVVEEVKEEVAAAEVAEEEVVGDSMVVDMVVAVLIQKIVVQTLPWILRSSPLLVDRPIIEQKEPGFQKTWVLHMLKGTRRFLRAFWQIEKTIFQNSFNKSRKKTIFLNNWTSANKQKCTWQADSI